MRCVAAVHTQDFSHFSQANNQQTSENTPLRAFDTLEKQIEAYIDVLDLLDERTDLKAIFKNEALIQKASEEKSKPDANELRYGKFFIQP